MNGWANGSWDRNAVEDVDWTGMATRTGVVNEHTVSASGGTDKMNAFGSFGYLNNKGTQYGQEYNRYTFRLGANITPVKWMTINMNINGSREEQEYGMSSAFAPSSTNSAAGLYELYKRNIRYAYPTNEDGTRIFNPVATRTSTTPSESGSTTSRIARHGASSARSRPSSISARSGNPSRVSSTRSPSVPTTVSIARVTISTQSLPIPIIRAQATRQNGIPAATSLGHSTT